MEERVCSRCAQSFPMAEFGITDRKTGRRKTWCKACERGRVNTYYAKNGAYRDRRKAAARLQIKTPEDNRRHNMKHMYNMTPELYGELLAAQDGRCALCGVDSVSVSQWESGHFYIDHSHETRRVRGLLCQKCNARLGSYEKLIAKVGEAAIKEYLARPSPVPDVPKVHGNRKTEIANARSLFPRQRQAVPPAQPVGPRGPEGDASGA